MTQATTNFDSATRAFYGELDANDPGVFQRHLAPAATFVFNDVDPVTGVEEIGNFVGAWKGNFKSVTHHIAAITADPAPRKRGCRARRLLRLSRRARGQGEGLFLPRLHRRRHHRMASLRRHQPAELTAHQRKESQMGRVEGKVALITGAARGQGRSHAIRLAEEGADIIAIDICEHIPSAMHTMGTEADLNETVDQVEKLDRRIVAKKADVRDRQALSAAIAEGVAELGRLDIVSINAGIASVNQVLDLSDAEWNDVINVNLTGAWHTAVESIPHILQGGRGGSVVFTSSAAGIKAVPNLGHYNTAKHGIIGLMKTLALELGPQGVRVNAVCPTNVDTPMLVNDRLMKLFMPHLEHPTRADAEAEGSNYRAANAIPIPWVEPADISNAVLFLASDEARYVTGIAMPVDAGFLLK